MEENYFNSVMLESDIQGYLYEPEYSVEELQHMEVEAAATVNSQASPAGEDSGTEWSRCVIHQSLRRHTLGSQKEYGKKKTTKTSTYTVCDPAEVVKFGSGIGLGRQCTQRILVALGYLSNA